MRRIHRNWRMASGWLGIVVAIALVPAPAGGQEQLGTQLQQEIDAVEQRLRQLPRVATDGADRGFQTGITEIYALAVNEGLKLQNRPGRVATIASAQEANSVAEVGLQRVTGLRVPDNLRQQIIQQNQLVQQQVRMGVALAPAGGLVGAEGVVGAPPSRFDWRSRQMVTPARNQLNCGSCWAFGTAGAYESALALASTGANGSGGQSLYNVSERRILDASNAGDCNGGWWAFDYVRDRGTVGETREPYRPSRQDRTNQNLSGEFRARTWGYVFDQDLIPTTESHRNQLKEALMRYGPLAVAINSTNAFLQYQGGVFRGVRSGGRDGRGLALINHAVLLIGWDDGQGAWIIKNSWGPNWGENGFGRVAYENNNIGFGAAWVSTPPLRDRNVAEGLADNSGGVIDPGVADGVQGVESPRPFPDRPSYTNDPYSSFLRAQDARREADRLAEDAEQERQAAIDAEWRAAEAALEAALASQHAVNSHEWARTLLEDALSELRAEAMDLEASYDRTGLTAAEAELDQAEMEVQRARRRLEALRRLKGGNLGREAPFLRRPDGEVSAPSASSLAPSSPNYVPTPAPAPPVTTPSESVDPGATDYELPPESPASDDRPPTTDGDPFAPYRDALKQEDPSAPAEAPAQEPGPEAGALAPEEHSC